jgi:hypothetical protein
VAVVQDTGEKAEHAAEPADWVHPWGTAQSAAMADMLLGSQAQAAMGTLLIMEADIEATLPGALLSPQSCLELHRSMREVSTGAWKGEDEATVHQ